MTYRPGDFYRSCERCGKKTRSSHTAKEWNNLIVCFECFEERQPQDFVRGRRDIQNVPDPRPEPPDTFVYHYDPEAAIILTEGGEPLLTELGERMYNET